MIGECARRVVTCTLVDTEGKHHVGTNLCLNAQSTCPRSENEGYEKCWSICKQPAHAEVSALITAADKSVGARAYVEGHSYACRNCQEALFSAGVASVSIGPPPSPKENAPIQRKEKVYVTPQMIKSVVAMRRTGAGHTAIARQHNISDTTVHRILQRENDK